MKKRWLSLSLLLLLLLLLTCPALAETERELPLVCDICGLLTDEEAEELDARAEQYSEAYGCEIILVVVPDTEGYNVEDYTEAVYNTYHYGWGEEKSGVILLLSMEERDYDLAAYGYGNVAFTDYGKEWLMDDVLPYLGSDDWYGGFSAYVEACADYLRQAREGTPVDKYYDSAPTRQGFYVTGGMVLLSLILGLIPAGIVVLVLRGRMKSAVLQKKADNYFSEPLQLYQQEDRFVRRDIRRVPRSSNSGSRGGGGGHGTSVRSSGFSHHSGKF